MIQKQLPIVRNLDNSPQCILFDQLQLGTKEYLTCWKTLNQNGHVNIKPNWMYCFRKSLQCYRTNIGDMI